MRVFGVVAAAAVFACACTPSVAIEGTSAAGPIGGSDIRAAQLPPPGFYAGLTVSYAEAHRFYDSNGNPVPALAALKQSRLRAGPFLLYVPDVDVFGGSVSVAGAIPLGIDCGRRFAATPRECVGGVGDPYVEFLWSRFFGTMRPSRYSGAYPIAEGLTIALGFGVVIPAGHYETRQAAVRGITVGNHVWDFAPTAAITYVTAPIIADGTEFSAKVYWNNYLTNTVTQYLSGSLVTVHFAVSEKIGRLQVGMAGSYGFQTADDRLLGVQVPPDGRRAEVLALGGVLAYDMPEFQSSIKVKALFPVVTRNSPETGGVIVRWTKRL